ncbi:MULTISPECIES: peroxiredoxin [Rhodanobacter]|uniref:peroxiredoxin n=1 Tax=Rhodanobacter TaxID=75309 RepID=UPI00048128CF|nr:MULTISPECIES: peroxiredoxin [Rhodanobacter]KZC21468.1 AhpC/TSA family antioxidant protein [Rhodanobacter denitrificans]UJJ51750.1 peroxiredoxin [Rhodanobacter denitrificans]UJM94494.1 peroxiredoxin [Rhodanobacter denitrificans]UJM98024.1 peroxiredoxin [Rhodanobacter denitrificans]UJN22562.1 peroxiredoxin [Rhodanobacter denitrificans]
MKKRFAGSMALGALLALASAMPAVAALAPGAVAPTFTARASQAGKEFTFSLADALRKGPVVVYFYPSAYTGGCDLEAHTFAVERDKFDAAGATIIGVSADSIERLDAFSADPKYCAGKFPVASDAEVKVALAYGLEAMAARPGMHDVRGVAIDHAFIPRTTFIIAGDGRIVATLSSETDHLRPDEHVKQSLAIVQRLQAGKAP